MRNLILVLGDQLDDHSAAFDGFRAAEDGVWMAELEQEATHVWCHKLRIAYFFSAMRHFRDRMMARKCRVHYHEMGLRRSQDRGRSFSDVLQKDVRRLKPRRLIVVEPGDFRVRREIQETADGLEVELEIRTDRHFYCSTGEFRDYARGRKNLLLEFFYREMRRRHRVLVDDDGQPIGGQWNFDKANRESFGPDGPGPLPPQKTFRPDETTRQVLQLVESRFSEHPGRLEHFGLPVTRRQARQMLKHFVERILPSFGRWEDAMWADEPFLFHSRLSAPLNVKLLDPRECVEAAVTAYRTGAAPLNSVEGFVRQILGWREFIRGVYWLKMPEYARCNFFGHDRDVPSFFWDARTDMECVRQSLEHVLEHGYTHHIQRLMVLGNLALLWGVEPRKFHEWHMAMYLDAVDWVSLPNTLGMSQFGDGGVVGTKPYCSSGNYINKMSNYCRRCRYNPKKRIGADACPITTLYWDFLDRHEDKLRSNPRMKFAMKNLQKLRQDHVQFQAIRQRAIELRQEL